MARMSHDIVQLQQVGSHLRDIVEEWHMTFSNYNITCDFLFSSLSHNAFYFILFVNTMIPIWFDLVCIPIQLLNVMSYFYLF
jgi:hypothetical protein